MQASKRIFQIPPTQEYHDASHYDVLVRTAVTNEGRLTAKKIASSYALNKSASARLERGMPVLVATRLSAQNAKRLHHELTAAQASVFLRSRDLKSEFNAPAPMTAEPPTIPDTTPTTKSTTRKIKLKVGITRRSLQNSSAVTFVLLLQIALTLATSTLLTWHLITHQHWLFYDLPWPFVISYIGGGVMLAALVLAFMRPFIAPTVAMHRLRFTVEPQLRMTLPPLRQLAAALEKTLPGTTSLWHFQGELVTGKNRCIRIHIELPVSPHTTMLEAARMLTAACRHGVPSRAAKWLIDSENILFNFWYRANVADVWDLAVDTRIEQSRNLQAAAWLGLRGVLMTTHLPALLMYWLARSMMTRGVFWRSCKMKCINASVTTPLHPLR